MLCGYGSLAELFHLGSNLCSLDDSCVNGMAPTVEPAVFTIVTAGFVGFALRTTMTINAIRIIAIILEIAWSHASNLPKNC